jgi:hypothetical protein
MLFLRLRLRWQRLWETLTVGIIPKISGAVIWAINPEQWGSNRKLCVSYLCNALPKNRSVIRVSNLVGGNKSLHQ